MIQRRFGTGKRRQRGVSAVEMMIATPVLVLLVLVVVDLGRVMYAGMTVANAARAGAGYGAQTGGTAVDHDGMRGASLADATNLPVDAYNTGHVAVTPRRFCRCVGTAGEAPSCVCPGGAAPEVYVEVRAVRDFRTLVPYPLIPASIPLSRTATIRVQ